MSTLEPALPYVVLGWLVGVFGLSAWHLGGWTQLQRLQATHGPRDRRPLQQKARRAQRPSRRASGRGIARIGPRRSPDRRRLAAAGDPAARQCLDGPEAGTTGGDPRPRTGAHPPVRLLGQHAANGGGNPRLLPSGRLVGFAPRSGSSGRTVATIWPCTSAAARSNTPRPSPAWRKSATAGPIWRSPPRAAVSWPASPACSAGPPSRTGVSPGCPAWSPCCWSSRRPPRRPGPRHAATAAGCRTDRHCGKPRRRGAQLRTVEHRKRGAHQTPQQHRSSWSSRSSWCRTRPAWTVRR